MKILHILYSGLGGHSSVFFSLVQSDEKKEFEYSALFSGIEEVREEYKERTKSLNIPWLFVKKRPGLDFSYYKKLYKSIKKIDPDFIFMHGSGVILPAKLAKVFYPKIKKIVVRETQANHIKTKKEWLLLSLSLMFADNIVFLSQSYKEEVKKKLRIFYSEKKIALIPNGINLSVFKPNEIRDDAEEILIGMQSRLVVIKDHPTLISALSKIIIKYPEIKAKLIIAGDGETRGLLETQVKNLGMEKNIIFTGMLNELDLLKFISSLQIYIHASYGETMSTAIMQAMACKKAIIASDVLGINNMITNNETGMLVPLKNVDAMEAAILALIHDKDEREKIALNALKYAETNFSARRMYEKYSEIFVG